MQHLRGTPTDLPALSLFCRTASGAVILNTASALTAISSIHFNGGKVSVKDWFYRNFPRVEKEYLKQEYAAITEIGKRMRSISPELCKQMTFQVLFYRYYNFDLDQPFLEQYKQNTRLLLEKLRQFELER